MNSSASRADHASNCSRLSSLKFPGDVIGGTRERVVVLPTHLSDVIAAERLR